MSVHRDVDNRHVLQRPSWTCCRDSAPWPCATRRAQLLADYAEEPHRLRSLMTDYLVDACQELPHMTAGEVHQQIVGWTEI